MGKNIGKNISKKFSGKYRHAKQSDTDLLETASKRATHKTEEASSDFTGNFQQNSSEIITKEGENIERDKEIQDKKKIYISRKKNTKLLIN